MQLMEPPTPSPYLDTPQSQQDVAYEWVCQHGSKSSIRKLNKNQTKSKEHREANMKTER